MEHERRQGGGRRKGGRGGVENGIRKGRRRKGEEDANMREGGAVGEEKEK